MTDTAPTYSFETLQIHAGSKPDPETGARQTPIYQNTGYVFRDTDHAAALFNLQEVGFIYSRLTNPTVSVLQERVATLEGGVGATACSSGHAAQILALLPLMGPGDNIVVYMAARSRNSRRPSSGSDGRRSSSILTIAAPSAGPAPRRPRRFSANPSPIPAVTSPTCPPSPRSRSARACP